VTPRAAGLSDAARLAVGTLTVVPVRPPRTVDPAVAGWAMAVAPLVGAGLAAGGAAALWLLGLAASPPLLAASLVLGLLTLLTRGMHLDGLADTADGLGSGRPAAAALEVMRRGDVGPFGVVTLVLVLLVQVTALGALLDAGVGGVGLLLALVVSRLVLPVLCWRNVPAARDSGLGRGVAGSVDPARILVALALATGVLVVPVAVGALDLGPALAAALLALLAGALVAGHAVRRLGGVTGDVLGAGVETTFATALTVLALMA
jgi:adenosylcobinamide-GDP ribazoletransferase